MAKRSTCSSERREIGTLLPLSIEKGGYGRSVRTPWKTDLHLSRTQARAVIGFAELAPLTRQQHPAPTTANQCLAGQTSSKRGVDQCE